MELHPLIDTDEGPFTLGTAAGHERKTTGSYYTPTSLINCLLDSALDPVVAKAIDVPDADEAEQALLNLKVCDPACGSGHFLIAAAERMATHLARLRTGDDQPNTLYVQHAKRDIIGRCIYGIDMNPMAVELCKVSLWMEALEPGKPLSYLDHHIQCGNSLLGTTPRLIEEGLPDDAFKPIEGDDKEVCKQLKKQNQDERKDEQKGQLRFRYELPAGNMADLPQLLQRINAAPDSSIAEVVAKEQEVRRLLGSGAYKHAQFLANAWCAAFVWKKDKSDLAKSCPTWAELRYIARHSAHAKPAVRDEVERLRDQYRFFHWHLAFPDVFRLPGQHDGAENEQCGWDGGFNVVLGNPPWEKINFRTEEYFAQTHPEIANASNKATRTRLINQLRANDSIAYQQFEQERDKHERISSFFRLSAIYPLTGLSRINLYSLFAELGGYVVAGSGRLGFVLASGIATDKNNRKLFQKVVQNSRLVSVYDFENRKKLFPEVDSRYKFCLFTAIGNTATPVRPDLAFYLTDVAELVDDDRHFSLTYEELMTINPSTGTCPVFRNKTDARVTRRSYEVGETWEASEKGKEWPGKPRTPFNMANDSKYFVTRDKIASNTCRMTFGVTQTEPSLYPLYEAKLVHQFNHRYASFGATGRALDETPVPCDERLLIDPLRAAGSRYWVPEDLFQGRFPGRWFLVFREVTNATNERTVISAVIPDRPCGHSLVVIDELSARNCVAMCANLNAMALDFVARQKTPGVHLNLWIWKQLPFLGHMVYSQPTPWADELKQDWIQVRCLELIYTAWDLEPFALDCGYAGPPFCWDEERRFLLRCELDAAYFHLYGIERDDVDYIMDTFPIVRRKDEQAHGEYRTKRVILEMYDQMAEATRTGQPYQTWLNPPPADSRVAHPPREVAVQIPAVDPAFPRTERERLLCALLLDFVKTQPGLLEDQYVDELGLAMNGDRCRKFLSGRDRTSFGTAASALRELATSQDMPWRDILGSLVASKAIRRENGTKLVEDENFDGVRATYPDVPATTIARIGKAAERLRELQESAAPADDEAAEAMSEAEQWKESVMRN